MDLTASQAADKAAAILQGLDADTKKAGDQTAGNYYGGGQGVWSLRCLSCGKAKLASPHLVAPVITRPRRSYPSACGARPTDPVPDRGRPRAEGVRDQSGRRLRRSQDCSRDVPQHPGMDGYGTGRHLAIRPA
jgi:hypothetical protein